MLQPVLADGKSLNFYSTAWTGACCGLLGPGFYLSAWLLCLGGLLCPCDESSFADRNYNFYGWKSCGLTGGPSAADSDGE